MVLLRFDLLRRRAAISRLRSSSADVLDDILWSGGWESVTPGPIRCNMSDLDVTLGGDLLVALIPTSVVEAVEHFDFGHVTWGRPNGRCFGVPVQLDRSPEHSVCERSADVELFCQRGDCLLTFPRVEDWHLILFGLCVLHLGHVDAKPCQMNVDGCLSTFKHLGSFESVEVGSFERGLKLLISEQSISAHLSYRSRHQTSCF